MDTILHFLGFLWEFIIVGFIWKFIVGHAVANYVVNYAQRWLEKRPERVAHYKALLHSYRTKSDTM